MGGAGGSWWLMHGRGRVEGSGLGRLFELVVPSARAVRCAGREANFMSFFWCALGGRGRRWTCAWLVARVPKHAPARGRTLHAPGSSSGSAAHIHWRSRPLPAVHECQVPAAEHTGSGHTPLYYLRETTRSLPGTRDAFCTAPPWTTTDCTRGAINIDRPQASEARRYRQAASFFPVWISFGPRHSPSVSLPRRHCRIRVITVPCGLADDQPSWTRASTQAGSSPLSSAGDARRNDSVRIVGCYRYESSGIKARQVLSGRTFRRRSAGVGAPAWPRRGGRAAREDEVVMYRSKGLVWVCVYCWVLHTHQTPQTLTSHPIHIRHSPSLVSLDSSEQ